MCSVVAGMLAWVSSAPGQAAPPSSAARASAPRAFAARACEDCPLPAAIADVFVLRDGSEVKARAVAENPDFWVLERFGQQIAIDRDSITEVRFGAGRKPDGLTRGDQILLVNGHPLVGKIVDDGAHFFRVSDGRLETLVAKWTVAKVYRDGKPLQFDNSAPHRFKVGDTYHR